MNAVESEKRKRGWKLFVILLFIVLLGIILCFLYSIKEEGKEEKPPVQKKPPAPVLDSALIPEAEPEVLPDTILPPPRQNAPRIAEEKSQPTATAPKFPRPKTESEEPETTAVIFNILIRTEPKAEKKTGVIRPDTANKLDTTKRPWRPWDN